MRITGIPILFMLLFSACGEHGHPHDSEQDHEHGDDHGHEHDATGHEDANAHMHQSSFDDLVARFEGEDRATWQHPAQVIALLGDIEGQSIIDIGAGTGYFSFRLAEKGAQVIAADVDERFLNYIKDKKSRSGDTLVTPTLVEYDDPLLGDSSIDHAIIVDTYHHIEDRVLYFNKVLKGLKESGTLMVVDFKKVETAHGPPVHIRISQEDVANELRQAGFKEIEINSILLEEQYIIVATR